MEAMKAEQEEARKRLEQKELRHQAEEIFQAEKRREAAQVAQKLIRLVSYLDEECCVHDFMPQFCDVLFSLFEMLFPEMRVVINSYTS